MGRRSRQSADGPGHRQSRLALPLRHRARRDAQRLRPQRRSAFASRAARLAGGRFPGARDASLKALHRRILLSNTYRQSSRFDPEPRPSMPTIGCSGDIPPAGSRPKRSATPCSASSGSAQHSDGRPELPAIHPHRIQLQLLRPHRLDRARFTTAARSTGSTSIRPRTHCWRRSIAPTRPSRPRDAP